MQLTINNKKINIITYDTFIPKLKGLMLKKDKIKNIYRFKKCNSIHTFFMKQNIDICITDKNNKILYLKENLEKNKIILPIKKGYYTYEMPLNTAKYLKINNKLKIED